MKILDYDLKPGSPFQRLITIKDSRTRRIRKVSSTAARMVYAGPIGSGVFDIPCSVNSAGEIEIGIDQETSLALSEGPWNFDVVADWRGGTEPVAKGTINVLPRFVDITPPYDAEYAMTRPPVEGDPFVIVHRNAPWSDTITKYQTASMVDVAPYEDGVYTAFFVVGNSTDSEVLAELTVDDIDRDDGVLIVSLSLEELEAIPTTYAYCRLDLVRTYEGVSYSYFSSPVFSAFYG